MILFSMADLSKGNRLKSVFLFFGLKSIYFTPPLKNHLSNSPNVKRAYPKSSKVFKIKPIHFYT